MVHKFTFLSTLATLSSALASSGHPESQGRRLALEPIAGYLPVTQVTDQAAIDLDQQKIEERVFVGEFAKARNVYTDGGHSFSFAELTLTAPVANKTFPKGTKVYGMNERSQNISGTLLDDVEWGVVGSEGVLVRVLYDTSDEQASYVDCQVGGLFTFMQANREGCFAGSGQVQLAPLNDPSNIESFDYSYDTREDNNNGRTIQGFSKDAAQAMFVNCSGTTEIVCTYFDDFQLYVNYYGDTDYADKWVLASSYAEQTNYSSGRGDADFALTQGTRGRARAETLQTATVALNIWMAIIQELEYATRNCASDSDSAVHSLDAAVAFYTGSLEGTSGTGSGILLHQLADEKASKMKTTKWAGNDVRGTAYVNLELFYHFGEMQDAIVGGACDTAASLKTDIIRLMKIPLIQGVVLDAWIRANDEDEPDVEEAKSRGATYAAAILPYVESCDPARAAVVYNNMRIGATDNDFDFSTLKTAIESVYDCLNIKCAEVGGVWSTRASEFEAGAAPCNDGKPIIARFTEAPTASPTASPTTISPTSSPTAAPSSTPVASGSSASASKLGLYAILSFGTLAALALLIE